MDRDVYYMREAIKEAKKAEDIMEVPIGCVIVLNDEIIARGHNLKESLQNALYHAEMVAIHEACKKQKSWRLEDAELYVTLEPCPMCAGGIIMSRVKRVIYGAKDPRAGCAGTLMNLLDDERFNHRCEVVSGVLEEECAEMLVSFFKKLRARGRRKKKEILAERIDNE